MMELGLNWSDTEPTLSAACFIYSLTWQYALPWDGTWVEQVTFPQEGPNNPQAALVHCGSAALTLPSF